MEARSGRGTASRSSVRNVATTLPGMTWHLCRVELADVAARNLQGPCGQPALSATQKHTSCSTRTRRGCSRRATCSMGLVCAMSATICPNGTGSRASRSVCTSRAKDAADASREGPESHRAHLHGVVCVGSLTSESGSSVHIPLLLSPSSLRLGYALLSRDFCLLLVCLLQGRSTSTDSDGDGSELLG